MCNLPTCVGILKGEKETTCKSGGSAGGGGGGISLLLLQEDSRLRNRKLLCQNKCFKLLFLIKIPSKLPPNQVFKKVLHDFFGNSCGRIPFSPLWSIFLTLHEVFFGGAKGRGGELSFWGGGPPACHRCPHTRTNSDESSSSSFSICLMLPPWRRYHLGEL